MTRTELLPGVRAGARRASPPVGVLSAVYLLAYLSFGMVAIILGIVVADWGLRLAVDLGAGVVTLLSLATRALASAMPASTCPPFRLAPGCACSNP